MAKIMSAQLQKLLEAQAKAEASKHLAEERYQRAKSDAAALADKERTHRLCVRGGHLEKYLIVPEEMPDEAVIKLIDFLFSSRYVQNLVREMEAVAHEESSKTYDEILDAAIDKQRVKDARNTQDTAGMTIGIQTV